MQHPRARDRLTRAFDELRQGIKEIESLADPTVGEVRVGCPDVFAAGLLSAVVDRFSRQCPRVVVSIAAANNVAQEFRQLRDRTVDFLLAGFPRSQTEDDLDIEFLYEDRPFIVTGRNNRRRGCFQPAVAAPSRPSETSVLMPNPENCPRREPPVIRLWQA